jgi:hypothetical protein
VRGEEGRLAWLLRQGAANGFELQRTENGQYDVVTREEPRSMPIRFADNSPRRIGLIQGLAAKNRGWETGPLLLNARSKSVCQSTI